MSRLYPLGRGTIKKTKTVRVGGGKCFRLEGEGTFRIFHLRYEAKRLERHNRVNCNRVGKKRKARFGGINKFFIVGDNAALSKIGWRRKGKRGCIISKKRQADLSS